MGLESDEQGHCPNMGNHHTEVPQAQAGRLGRLGRQSVFTYADNKLVFCFVFFIRCYLVHLPI